MNNEKAKRILNELKKIREKQAKQQLMLLKIQGFRRVRRHK